MLYRSRTPAMHVSHHLAQLGTSALVSAALAALTRGLQSLHAWVNAHVFAIWLGMDWFFGLVLIDMVTGAVMHWRRGTFNWADLLGKTFVNKLFIGLAWLASVAMVGRFLVHNPNWQPGPVTEFWTNATLLGYMLRSIFANLRGIYPGFPFGSVKMRWPWKR